MIFRISTGRARNLADSQEYAAFLESSVFPELRGIAGHLGAYLVRRETPADVEVRIITVWESREAIASFAGDDLEAAVFEPEARRLLPERDDRVQLFDVVLDHGPHRS